MIRIALPFVYDLAAKLEPISAMPYGITPLIAVRMKLFMAKSAVENLISASLFAPYLRASYALSQNFLGVVEPICSDTSDNRILTELEIYQIKTNLEQYRTTLLAELGIFHTYLVQQKGPYDTWHLLMSGESLFPLDMAAKVPEAVFDAREAGKCLAYESSTAAGFHLFRVLESVLRSYYRQVTSGKAEPKARNIAVYVNALRVAGQGSEKTLMLLKQISDLYRNPIIHPEVVLTVDEAISVCGLVRTVVTEMLSEIAIAPPTTTGLAALYGPTGTTGT